MVLVRLRRSPRPVGDEIRRRLLAPHRLWISGGPGELEVELARVVSLAAPEQAHHVPGHARDVVGGDAQ